MTKRMILLITLSMLFCQGLFAEDPGCDKSENFSSRLEQKSASLCSIKEDISRLNELCFTDKTSTASQSALATGLFFGTKPVKPEESK